MWKIDICKKLVRFSILNHPATAGSLIYGTPKILRSPRLGSRHTTPRRSEIGNGKKGCNGLMGFDGI